MCSAAAQLMDRWKRVRLIRRGRRRFRGDIRYDLDNVSRGFAPRLPNRYSDEILLDRICTAYIRAVERQQEAQSVYAPTPWWQEQTKGSLKPVMEALRTRDLQALQRMYENFFRDPCSAGLIAPRRMSKDYFGATIEDAHRQHYLIDSLYRIEHWKHKTGGCYKINDLAGPAIGNPFGVMFDGTLIRMGSDYQHYCAHRIRHLLAPGPATVMEIGGGYGGLAYYLLRDRPRTSYIDFDLPESCALTAYYILKAFPELKVLLYGEARTASCAMSGTDVALLPVFELAKMPGGSADLVFSSHSMSDLPTVAMDSYMSEIARVSRGHFLYIGNSSSGRTISMLAEKRKRSFQFAYRRPSGWYRHVVPGASDMEILFEIESLEEVACESRSA
jgi:putative sugar O-methyltransferase